MLKKILIVDDEPNNLQLLRQILKGKFQLIFANCGLKALSAVQEHQPDLILLDIMMPDLSGYEVCEKLKSNPVTKDIPVIFVTAMSDVDDETKGFDVGAVDYIQKPISGAIVLRRVQTHLSLVKVNELEKVQKDTVFMLGEAGHYNDNDTGAHIWRMAAYSRALASAAGWSDEMAELMELAAPMHDTGKIGIPDEILKAPRKLTPEEWVIMKQHTQIGADILNKSDSKLINLASEIALSHHEKWDGSGYPNNLVGEAIPESGRIVAITDVFDALSMKRPYKDAWPLESVIEEIVKNAGSAFDPRLVDIFQQILPQILEIKQVWDNKN
ncbi:response regulator [Marinomonas sp. PE14-40]|uniref:response regulator n=1 Tax=Marinomonas sp. PE14-40 TaxID=3060621 RepID=UPI003F663569